MMWKRHSHGEQNCFPIVDVDEQDIDAVIYTLPIGGDLCVNLDVDALDPSEMPAVIGPASGELTYRQAVAIIEKTCSRCRVVGFSLAELYPFLDTNGFSALTAGRLICNAMDRIARQQRMKGGVGNRTTRDWTLLPFTIVRLNTEEPVDTIFI